MCKLRACDNHRTVFIGDAYSLDSDTLQWIVSRKIKATRRDGSGTYDKWELVGYYPRLDQALLSLLDQKIRAEHKAEVQSLFWLLGEAKKEIIEATQSIKTQLHQATKDKEE